MMPIEEPQLGNSWPSQSSHEMLQRYSTDDGLISDMGIVQEDEDAMYHENFQVCIGDHCFQCLDVLGKGSYSEVWRARVLTEGAGVTEVALKDVLGRSEGELEQAMFEVKILLELERSVTTKGINQDQMRIPRCISYKVSQTPDGGRVRMAMTVAPGESLDVFMLKPGPAWWTRSTTIQIGCALAAQLVRQLAPTLDNLAPIAWHRDISSHNILINGLQEETTARTVVESTTFWLIDFGLAVDSQTWVLDEAWRTKDIGGDCRYWPPSSWIMHLLGPEGFLHRPAFCEQYKHRLDIHGLGISALELLCTVALMAPSSDGLNKHERQGAWVQLFQVWQVYRQDVWRWWSEVYTVFSQGGDLKPVQHKLLQEGIIEQLMAILAKLRRALRGCAARAEEPGLAAFLRALADMVDEDCSSGLVEFAAAADAAATSFLVPRTAQARAYVAPPLRQSAAAGAPPVTGLEAMTPGTWNPWRPSPRQPIQQEVASPAVPVLGPVYHTARSPQMHGRQLSSGKSLFTTAPVVTVESRASRRSVACLAPDGTLWAMSTAAPVTSSTSARQQRRPASLERPLREQRPRSLEPIQRFYECNSPAFPPPARFIQPPSSSRTVAPTQCYNIAAAAMGRTLLRPQSVDRGAMSVSTPTSPQRTRAVSRGRSTEPIVPRAEPGSRLHAPTSIHTGSQVWAQCHSPPQQCARNGICFTARDGCSDSATPTNPSTRVRRMEPQVPWSGLDTSISGSSGVADTTPGESSLLRLPQPSLQQHTTQPCYTSWAEVVPTISRSGSSRTMLSQTTAAQSSVVEAVDSVVPLPQHRVKVQPPAEPRWDAATDAAASRHAHVEWQPPATAKELRSEDWHRDLEDATLEVHHSVPVNNHLQEEQVSHHPSIAGAVVPADESQMHLPHPGGFAAAFVSNGEASSNELRDAVTVDCKLLSEQVSDTQTAAAPPMPDIDLKVQDLSNAGNAVPG